VVAPLSVTAVGVVCVSGHLPWYYFVAGALALVFYMNWMLDRQFPFSKSLLDSEAELEKLEMEDI